VKALQQYLNAHGYTIAASGTGSIGNETTTFGPLTKAALVKYQKAKGITPAVGYFGPLTRAAVNAGE
jgi:peptidoglycan hydrolase-like protein with peptidoglycan-binding domain